MPVSMRFGTLDGDALSSLGLPDAPALTNVCKRPRAAAPFADPRPCPPGRPPRPPRPRSDGNGDNTSHSAHAPDSVLPPTQPPTHTPMYGLEEASALCEAMWLGLWLPQATCSFHHDAPPPTPFPETPPAEVAPTSPYLVIQPAPCSPLPIIDPRLLPSVPSSASTDPHPAANGHDASPVASPAASPLPSTIPHTPTNSLPNSPISPSPALTPCDKPLQLDKANVPPKEYTERDARAFATVIHHSTKPPCQLPAPSGSPPPHHRSPGSPHTSSSPSASPPNAPVDVISEVSADNASCKPEDSPSQEDTASPDTCPSTHSQCLTAPACAQVLTVTDITGEEQHSHTGSLDEEGDTGSDPVVETDEIVSLPLENEQNCSEAPLAEDAQFSGRRKKRKGRRKRRGAHSLTGKRKGVASTAPSDVCIVHGENDGSAMTNATKTSELVEKTCARRTDGAKGVQAPSSASVGGLAGDTSRGEQISPAESRRIMELVQSGRATIVKRNHAGVDLVCRQWRERLPPELEEAVEVVYPYVIGSGTVKAMTLSEWKYSFLFDRSPERELLFWEQLSLATLIASMEAVGTKLVTTDRSGSLFMGPTVETLGDIGLQARFVGLPRRTRLGYGEAILSLMNDERDGDGVKGRRTGSVSEDIEADVMERCVSAVMYVARVTKERKEVLEMIGMRRGLLERRGEGACEACGRVPEEGGKRCGRCGSAVYCGRDCQRAHWSRHKSDCFKHPSK